MFKKNIRINLTLKFLIWTGAVLATTLGILFSVLVQLQEELIRKQVANEATVIFKQIVLTRQWIADHGGVFVEKLPWVKSDGTGDEMADATGRKFIKKTPATVTKDLSQYAREKGLYWFHLTSLKLTNPENAPDAFERRSLTDFEEKAATERSKIETIGNARYFRYAAPLYVEPACLHCHDRQGYIVGDVRGAISITIPMEDTFIQLKKNRVTMFLVGFITTAFLLSSLYLMMMRMVISPVHRLKASIKAFAEGVHSPENAIRTGDELEDLGNSFSDMAQSLTKYHTTLEERIANAVRDLEETNRKLTVANEQLTEMNRKKSDFVAKASHELRTPLTSIKGAMDYISVRLQSIALAADGTSDAASPSRLADLLTFFDIIKKNAERLIRMVNDLLDLERIEQGKAELHFTEVDMSLLIREVVAGFTSSAVTRNISVRVETPDNLPAIADGDRLRQVLINLLSNSLKYSPDGSDVLVRAVDKGGRVVVTVTDRGPGIPLEEQERIFDRFYTKSDKTGTGLGLAISKGIIEAHHGTIGVVSDGLEGSSFFFMLPLFNGGQE